MGVFSSILMMLLVFSTDVSETKWKKIRNSENVTVYARKLEETGLKEVKVIGHVKCPMSEIVAALEDVIVHKTWVLRTTESKFVEQINNHQFVYYIAVDMPFPVRDRDIVLTHLRTQDPITKAVSIVSIGAPDDLPLVEDMIRITDYSSEYKLTPMDHGLIELSYIMRVDPGGSLPKWLVNLAAAKGPFKTVKALFKLLEDGQYRGVDPNGVID